MKKRIEIEAKFELLNTKELLKILEELEKDNNAKFRCREVETNVDDIEAIREIFDVLKVRKLVVVEKIRTSYLYKDIIISIDTVEKLRKFCRVRI